MKNTSSANGKAPHLIYDIAEWHYKRNLIDGTTDKKQITKCLEEFIELYQSIHKFDSVDDLVSSIRYDLNRLWINDRIDVSEKSKTEKAMKDAIGDISVVMINHCERNKFTLSECLQEAYDDIKDRKGKMINGTFVKESDL